MKTDGTPTEPSFLHWPLKKESTVHNNIVMCCLTRSSASASLPAVTTTTALPDIHIEPLFVELTMPSSGRVQKDFPITYNIHNRTPYSQEVEFGMDTSEAFMFAGHKLVGILQSLPPHLRVYLFEIYFLLALYIKFTINFFLK